MSVRRLSLKPSRRLLILIINPRAVPSGRISGLWWCRWLGWGGVSWRACGAIRRPPSRILLPFQPREFRACLPGTCRAL